ncbi:MAG: tetratricopeptide repeat protein [Pseudonocardia sp.]|nr:MAG: tetratricopeptide repeat protein [Pseudonocardia sp.]
MPSQSSTRTNDEIAQLREFRQSPVVQQRSRLERARYLFRAGAWKRALDEAQLLVDDGTGEPSAIAVIGSAHVLVGLVEQQLRSGLAIAVGAFEKAARELRAAGSAVRDDGEYVADLGVALAMTGSSDAERVLRHAQSMAIDTPEVRRCLGNALAASGRDTDAWDVLIDAVRRAPNDWLAQIELAKLAERLHGRDTAAQAWLLAGETLRASDRIDEAVAAADRAMAFHPDNVEAAGLRHSLVPELKDEEDALASAFIDLNPNDIESLTKYGRLYAESGDLVKAEQLLRRARDLRRQAERPPDSAALADLGRVLYLQDRHLEALELLDEAIELDPENSIALVTRGEALCGLGRYDESLQPLRTSIELLPGEAYPRVALADALRLLGRLDDARSAVNSALDIAADDVQALAIRGDVNLAMKDIEGARRDLDAALLRSPDYLFALLVQRELFYRLGRVDEVLPYWRAAAHSDDSGLGIEYAETLRMAGLHVEALSALDQVLLRNPEHPGALRFLGRTQLELGRRADAIATLQRALSIAPDSAETAVELAAAQEEDGRPLEAVATLRQLNRQWPSVDSLLAESRQFAHIGAWEEALTVARAAVEHDPDRPEPYQALGWALNYSGQYRHPDSHDAFRRAMELGSVDAWSRNALADTLWLHGERAEAKLLYESVADEAVDLNDGHGQCELGWSLMCLRRHEEAAVAYSRARSVSHTPAILFDIGLNSLMDSDGNALWAYDEAFAMIDSRPDLRHRGALGVADRDIEMFVAGERILSSDIVTKIVEGLQMRIDARPLPEAVHSNDRH